jgi:hypothetical protein
MSYLLGHWYSHTTVSRITELWESSLKVSGRYWGAPVPQFPKSKVVYKPVTLSVNGRRVRGGGLKAKLSLKNSWSSCSPSGSLRRKM